jgi:probable rRNA maturation factor
MIGIGLRSGVRSRLAAADLPRLRRRLARILRAASLTDGHDYEVALELCDDAAMRELNRVYRGKDRPTDVLAFAQREGRGGALHPALLGDVVISVDTAARQARRGLAGEILLLFAHGLCHLLGYDHKTDAEQAVMDARVGALLAEAKRRGRVRPA